MHYTQYLWGIFYLTNILLLSMAIGTMALMNPRLLSIPRLSRFLTGFCSAPFVLACSMLLVSALPISVPRLFFLLSPTIASLLVIFKYRKHFKNMFSIEIASIKSDSSKCNMLKILYLSTAVVILIVIFKMLNNSLSPVVATDAAQYLSEALKFCKTLSIDSINGFRGFPDGTLRGNIHNFIWPAYLSHALIATDMSFLGYPFDYAARIAFQITIIYMLLSLIALSGLLKLKGVRPLSILVVLLVPHFEYVSYHFSRDAFRIIPLLLLTIVLIGSIHQLKTYKHFYKFLVLPLVAAFFCVGGHTLGILPMASIVLAWLLCALKLRRGAFRYNIRILVIAMAVAIGTLIGGSQVIQAYIETGSIVGDAAYNDQAIAGTPLEKEYIVEQTERLKGTTNTLERVNLITSRDYYVVSIGGLMTALIMLFRRWKDSSKSKTNPIFIISIIVLINALTISDLFGWAGFSLTKWYVMNMRYQLHFYPFSSICIAAFIVGLYAEYKPVILKNSNTSVRRALFAAPLALIIFFSLTTVVIKWGQRDPAAITEYLYQTLDPIEAAASEHSVQNILLDDMRYNYYLNSSAVLMYTKPTWPIIKATSANQLGDAFRSLNIQLVAFTNDGIKQYWSKLYLYKYLEDPQYCELLSDNGRIRIYLLKF